MRFDRIKTTIAIENSELENYSFNLIHYFMDKEGYSIFNFEEKIIENFNHDYYNIVFVYSSPLYTVDNVEVLLEKVAIIKRKLKRFFFMFNPSILVLATNCNMNIDNIEHVDNLDIIDVSSKEKLYENDLINDVFPFLKTFPLNLPFEELTKNINYLSMSYAKNISAIFNKKHYLVNVFLIAFILLPFILLDIFPMREYLALSREKILNFHYYTLITNSLYDPNAISVVLSFILIINFGLRMEKIYGSMRYLFIILFSTIIINSIIFAFHPARVELLGYSPILYGLLGSFVYVVIFFRRFLAFTLRKILLYNTAILFIFIFFGDSIQLIGLVCSIILGFILGFIVGIPKTKSGNINHRILLALLLLVTVFLSISIGLK